MEPISDSEPHAVAAAHALVPSSAVIKDDAQQHASSASLGMPGNAFRQSQAEQPQGSSGMQSALNFVVPEAERYCATAV